MSFLALSFFKPEDRINKNILSEARGNYVKGSASLTPDSSKLVNRLVIKGGKALSNDFTQSISVSGSPPVPLLYTPRATTDGVTVTINSIPKTVGIQYVHNSGVYDFLLNFQEKLLIPDLCTTGSGTIVYRYEYPIKLQLEDYQSYKDYGGWFDDVLKVDTDDEETALLQGLRYLTKYSRPVIAGSIQPLGGVYRPGQLVKVEIPSLNINDCLLIKEVTYDSVPGQGRVEIRLQLESAGRDLTGILKEHAARLEQLEKQVYQDEEGPVLKYIAREEAWGWAEDFEDVPPIASEEIVTWAEVFEYMPPITAEEMLNWAEMFERVPPVEAEEVFGWGEITENIVHPCLLPSETLYPSNTLYPW